VQRLLPVLPLDEDLKQQLAAEFAGFG